ncbi:G-type lectin S-receptor-like serine/threonine-protein kinase [Camellia lanceoleosa]|uniref:G-type lectin S-receptor-like serine/threonine-protein kinase n=1 Tax=Camellia lanceoleosa TaxID=1840588 RepID=A0ACC0HJ82_9ERIC|nr:G-type lectin S-receptor-like serine/threonine-protein kinase [Camellia lanceoleosa]
MSNSQSLWIRLETFSNLSLKAASSSEMLVVGQEIREWENISSPNGYFQLGFFSSPSGSTNRYLGIQVSTTLFGSKTVVLLANRDNPLTDSSRVQKITQERQLMINDSKGIAITLNSEQSSSISISATSVSHFMVNTRGSGSRGFHSRY